LQHRSLQFPRRCLPSRWLIDPECRFAAQGSHSRRARPGWRCGAPTVRRRPKCRPTHVRHCTWSWTVSRWSRELPGMRIVEKVSSSAKRPMSPSINFTCGLEAEAGPCRTLPQARGLLSTWPPPRRIVRVHVCVPGALLRTMSYDRLSFGPHVHVSLKLHRGIVCEEKGTCPDGHMPIG